MSDQSKWLKLWESALTDPHLENLSLEDWARYVRLMLYIKCHGHLGRIQIPEPFKAIKNLFRVESIDQINAVLKSFPNLDCYIVPCNDKTCVTLHLHFSNWYKYQIDSSAHRVKRWRAKVTQQKRREESNDSSSTSTASRTGYVGTTPAAQRENGKPIIKNYEEAGPNDLCGPPPGMAKRLRETLKGGL
jgi:hypothetical protein